MYILRSQKLVKILLSVNDIDTAGGVAHASAAQVVHRMELHAFIVAQRGGGDACRLLTQCLHVVARQNEVVREGLVPPLQLLWLVLLKSVLLGLLVRA